MGGSNKKGLRLSAQAIFVCWTETKKQGLHRGIPCSLI